MVQAEESLYEDCEDCDERTSYHQLLSGTSAGSERVQVRLKLCPGIRQSSLFFFSETVEVISVAGTGSGIRRASLKLRFVNRTRLE